MEMPGLLASSAALEVDADLLVRLVDETAGGVPLAASLGDPVPEHGAVAGCDVGVASPETDGAKHGIAAAAAKGLRGVAGRARCGFRRGSRRFSPLFARGRLCRSDCRLGCACLWPPSGGLSRVDDLLQFSIETRFAWTPQGQWLHEGAASRVRKEKTRSCESQRWRVLMGVRAIIVEGNEGKKEGGGG